MPSAASSSKRGKTPTAAVPPDAAAVRRRRRLRIPLIGGPLGRIWYALSAGHRSWRRSLQLRMVTYTLVFSSLLVGAFGVLVVTRTAQGLVNAKVKQAQAAVASGATYALNQITGLTQPDDPKLGDNLQQIVDNLAGGGQTVVIFGRSGPQPGYWVSQEGQGVAPLPVLNAISNQLRDVVEPAATGTEAVPKPQRAHQFVMANPDTLGLRPSLVVGIPLIAGKFNNYGLYYIYPLDVETQAIGLTRNTVIIVGIALVVLLAVLVALVTRLVVRPVRLAARTAQRLSAGLLDQRMEVKGEDDLAMLGASFNQMAANLQRQIQRLEEMSRLQRRFTSDVSHELRTPLTTVRMASDLIFSARDDLEPLMARSAELLNVELDRFEELLTDLLEISRFDAGFANLDAEPTNLVPVVHRVVERLRPLAQRAGVEVTVNVPDESVIAEVDRHRAERILRNLVGNAVEHAEGKPVTVTVAADDSAVAVTVRDHGIGLRPGEEKLVFNRFWRADPSRARQTGGTGLGLSISIEDARLHNGWLEAWGAPGQGAQFRLVLPVRAGGRLTGSPLPLVPSDADIVPPSAPAPPNGSAPGRSGSATARSGSVTARSGSATARSGSATAQGSSAAAPPSGVIDQAADHARVGMPGSPAGTPREESAS